MVLDQESRVQVFCDRIAHQENPDELLELALEIEALLYDKQEKACCEVAR